MSGVLTPGERPDPWNIVGDHHRRIRALEALRPESSAEGIQFNSGTYGPLNVGDWLSVRTTSSTSGVGIRLQADAGDLYLTADGVGGDATLNSTFGQTAITSALGNALVSAGTRVNIHANSEPIFMDALGGTTEAMIQMRVSDGNYVTVMDNTPIEQFRLTIGGTGSDEVLAISDATGSRVLRMDVDGILHLKAGGSIVYDL